MNKYKEKVSKVLNKRSLRVIVPAILLIIIVVLFAHQSDRANIQSFSEGITVDTSVQTLQDKFTSAKTALEKIDPIIFELSFSGELKVNQATNYVSFANDSSGILNISEGTGNAEGSSYRSGEKLFEQEYNFSPESTSISVDSGAPQISTREVQDFKEILIYSFVEKVDPESEVLNYQSTNDGRLVLSGEQIENQITAILERALDLDNDSSESANSQISQIEYTGAEAVIHSTADGYFIQTISVEDIFISLRGGDLVYLKNFKSELKIKL